MTAWLRIAVCLVAALGGCAPVCLTPEEPTTVGEYRLQPGDRIEIRQAGAAVFDTVCLVAPDGRIVVPGIERPVVAQELTVPGLSALLTTVYRQAGIFETPIISVRVAAFGNREAFVGGEVRRPGVLKLRGTPLTLMQAIVASGSLLPTARHEVMIVRTLPDGRLALLELDLDKVISGADLEQNSAIQPMDVVIVPRLGVAVVDIAVDQYVRQMVPVPLSWLFEFSNGPVPLR